jgi:hypothetical protein
MSYSTSVILINQQITPAELQIILQTFENADYVFANGFIVNGKKYTVIMAEDTSLAGRQVLPHIFRIAEPDAGRRAGRESWLSRQERLSSWRITRKVL